MLHSAAPRCFNTGLMNRIISTVTASLLFLSAQFAFACDYPARPPIPDGASASKDELLAAKASVQKYMEDVDAYLMCIEEAERAAISELDNPTEEELQRRDDMLTKRFDAANDEKALVGEQFNQQIRAFNARVQSGSE
jgi:hypothetical protein